MIMWRLVANVKMCLMACMFYAYVFKAAGGERGASGRQL